MAVAGGVDPARRRLVVPPARAAHRPAARRAVLLGRLAGRHRARRSASAQGIIHPYYTVALAPRDRCARRHRRRVLWRRDRVMPRRVLLAARSRSPRSGRTSCSAAPPTWHPVAAQRRAGRRDRRHGWSSRARLGAARRAGRAVLRRRGSPLALAGPARTRWRPPRRRTPARSRRPAPPAPVGSAGRAACGRRRPGRLLGRGGQAGRAVPGRRPRRPGLPADRRRAAVTPGGAAWAWPAASAACSTRSTPSAALVGASRAGRGRLHLGRGRRRREQRRRRTSSPPVSR